MKIITDITSNDHGLDVLNIAAISVRALSEFMEGCVYKNWSDETARSNANNVAKKLKNAFEQVDFSKCSAHTLELLGFSKFELDGDTRDKDIKGSIMLIPLYLYNSISGDTVVYNIFGKKCLMKDADTDVRCGYLAYGFPMKSTSSLDI